MQKEGKMRKLLTALMMFVLLLPVSATAEKIIIAGLGTFPPYQYEENGQMVGTDPDTAREVCKRLGIEAEFQIMPWKRILVSAEKGLVTAVVALLHTEERTQFLYYTDETIHVQKNVIMASKEKGIKINTLDDLKDKTVGVVREFSYGSEFDSRQGLKKEICDDQKEVVRMLDKGRIDVAATSERPFRFMCKEVGVQDHFEVVYVLSENPTYMGFSKAGGEKNKVLAEKFSQTLRQLREEGVIQKIIDKYLR
jgi:polar amino acid transport system substrate-binding protein